MIVLDIIDGDVPTDDDEGAPASVWIALGLA